MILDGKKTSSDIKEEISLKTRECLIKPSLAVIQIGEDEASEIYINSKKQACKEVGIGFKHIKFPSYVEELEVINKIKELNNDNYINGILLQLPIPERIDSNKLINLIKKEKDVDGLTDSNMAKLFKGNPNIIPCTPLGIITLLKKNNIEIEGKHAVIVGKSNLVGKPLAMLLLNEGATVSVCHSRTKNLAEMTQTADILVSAAGHAGLITSDMVKEQCVVIDVGISRIDGKILGDVDSAVANKVSAISLVPGGVGPMTVTMLLNNVIKCYENKGTIRKSNNF